MFLQLAHTRLNVYQSSEELILQCYRVIQKLPGDERFALAQQLRRAAISVHLNLAEGCSRKSQAERNRFFEIARGSLIEIDTAIGAAYKLQYVQIGELQLLGDSIIKTFKLLSGMIKP